MNRDPRAWARLGRALRDARERRGLTQEQLAEKAGDVSARSVQEAEKGRVPKGRMPYTLAPIARSLGWPPGSVEAVLEGADPPGGWQDVPVQHLIDEQRLEGILTGSMVRATDNVTSAEIKEAVRLALEEFRREGLI